MASLPLPTIYPSLRRPHRPLPFIKKTNSICRGGRIQFRHGKLEMLYDDGYMTVKGAKDYLEAVTDLVKFNHGQLRWFCPVDCGPPIKDSPLLLFLPGVDGIGMGLFMHHKALGRIFEVRCMHVPFSDRTPFEGLVNFVEDVVRLEHSTSPNRPIYLIGHSFGGCLALSVAARNPNIDLIVILSNPDNQVKTALESTKIAHNPLQTLDKLLQNLFSPLQRFSILLDNISKETISWKLKLLKSAACYANSRLHAVRAEVLVLASSFDSLLPSRDEAERLGKSLLNCKVYYFDNHGHNLLMESGVHLCSIIKSTGLYRFARQHDYITDFLPPTMTELQAVDKMSQMLYLASSPVIFSTMEDGKIVRGLDGVPNDGPVLLVGNHMMLGLDLIPFIAEFLREKRIVLRGMGHPVLFNNRTASLSEGHDYYDFVRLFGGVPVSFRNLYRLLSEKAFVLLYPGGSREALHRKGEEYKLFWPTQPEFVRMAAQFGATIVPFAAVGEDDIGKLLLDYNDFMSIPFMRDKIKEVNGDIKSKNGKFGHRDQDLFLPFVLPRIPGRFYYLFGKPITTIGKMEALKEREAANAMYLHVKSEVERMISYLLKKREEDAYRSIFQRTLYRATWDSSHQIPTFEP